MSARKSIFVVPIAVALAMSASPARAQYTFHSFDGPNDANGTTANGINNNGQIVGFGVDSSESRSE
jgi:hypothetical protein